MDAIKNKKSSTGRQTSKHSAENDYNDQDNGEPELTDTLFIRNLATFDTTQESLKEYIEKNFGETVYCLICKDKETGMSKGTAFVKFKSPNTAQQCLNEFDNPQLQTKFFLDGRNIFILPALTRDKISEVKRAKAPNLPAEDVPKRKKKPRHNRPQTKISQVPENSETPAKEESKPNRYKAQEGKPFGKAGQKRGATPSNRPPKHADPRKLCKKNGKKDSKKKNKGMSEKVSRTWRGRH